MKIDFDSKIVSASGEIQQRFKNRARPEEGSMDATLAFVCSDALTGNYMDEQGIAGEERVKRFALAMKIVNGGIVDVTVEEAAEIKKLVNKGFPDTTVVANVWRVIDAT